MAESLNTGMSDYVGNNLLTDENNEDWRKACKIAAQALQHGLKLIKPGESILGVTEAVEAKIAELGGEMAFPPQISLDHTAAHFCPDASDETVFDTQIAKLDLGVHINGWIGDNARTVDLSGEHAELVKAAENALEAAVKLFTPGRALGEVGRAIQETIAQAGYSPIRNLSGHGLAQFVVHCPPNIPNFDTGDETKLQENQVFAIEPFATTGQGVVVDTSNATIFSIANPRPQRDRGAMQVLNHCKQYNGLPFTSRWLHDLLPQFRLKLALRSLKMTGAMRAYPPLVEKTRGIVSQAEYTVRVADKPEVLTRA